MPLEHDASSEEESKSFSVRWYGARHTQTLLMSFLICIAFAIRVSLSVAIVAMTTPNTSSNPDVPTYEWTDESVMLSSYYWGYIIPQIVVGQLAQKYGAKWLLTGSSILGSIFTIIIPFIAPYGSWVVMLCRASAGFCHGFFFPCCHNLLAKWVPTHEKSKLSSMVYGAGPLGMAISLAATGWVSGTWVGWPYAFYGHGVVGLIWTVFWIFLGKNSPQEHTGIDPKEKKYIERSVKTIQAHLVVTPWKEIATSLPVWAIVISSFGQVWGFSTLMTNVPRYSAAILGYDIEDNGILSAAPYLVFWVTSFFFSATADYLISSNIVSTKVARIIMNSIGIYLPDLGLVILAVLITNLDHGLTAASISISIILLALSSSTLSGYHVNHIDIAPTHAGTLMGISNGFGNIAAIVAPLIVQFIVLDEKNPSEWATVLYISAGVGVAANTFFLLFSSGNLQSWNNFERSKNKLNDAKI